MKKLYFLSAAIITSITLILVSPNQEVNFHDGFRKPGEAPGGRKSWDAKRLLDPSTGKVPNNMHSRELKFAQSLPNDINNSSLEWRAEGPYNVGGRTRALAFDCTNENILLAGGASGGVWRSTNQGESWAKMTNPFQLHNVTCIDQDTREGKEHIWYHGTGELTGSSASGGDAYFDGNGIYKSTDGGVSWDSIPFTADNIAAGAFNPWDFVWNVALDPSNSEEDELYAATYGSIHRSIDGGSSWEVQLGGGSAYYNNVEVTTEGVVYATLSSDGKDKGIWRSDNGTDWTNIIPDDFPTVYGRTAIGINPSNENEVYFLTSETEGYGQYSEVFFNGDTWTSFWKYTFLCGDGSDTCGTWEALHENIPAGGLPFDNFNAQGGYDLLVKVKPDEPNIVFIGGTNLWRSTDGFTSDSNITQIGGYFEGSAHGNGNWDIYDTHHPDQHDLLFLPSNPDVILSATDGGVYKSNNCKATPHVWERLNNGYQTTQLYAVTMSKEANDPLILGGFQDNGNFVTFSEDNTADWTMPFNGDGSYSAIADNKEDFYIQIQRGVLYKMQLDNSGEIQAYNRMDPLSADTFDYGFINYLAMDPNNDNIIYFPEGNVLWRNNDAGNFPYNNSHERSDFGWEAFADSLAYNDDITVVAVSTAPANTVYYGTDDGRLFRIYNAHEGNPGHVEVTDNEFPSGGYVTGICIDPQDASNVIVVFSNYNKNSLFFSSDNGNTWGNISGNLEEPNASGFYTGTGDGPSCRTAAIAHLASGETLYIVGTSTGLYATSELDPYSGISMQETTKWTQIGTQEIGNVVIENIQFREADGKLLVGTHGTGIYSATISSLNDIYPTSITELPNQQFFSVYPNPSTSYTTVKWENKDIHTLIVADAMGKIVWEQKTQNQQIQIDNSNWPKGIYYIILKSKQEQYTQKLIVQ